VSILSRDLWQRLPLDPAAAGRAGARLTRRTPNNLASLIAERHILLVNCQPLDATKEGTLALYTINAVRKEPAYGPAAHQHISAVRLTNGAALTRAEVIAHISAGDTYTTIGEPQGRVYVHPCPWCGFGQYITTRPDATTTNNLDNLPLF
jgi:Protein of unknown function (DUF3892)